MNKVIFLAVLILNTLLSGIVHAEPASDIRANSYPFINKVNDIPEDEKLKIKTTLAACADLMSFDIKNYDYDKLFKYVLYTHDNFKVLTDIAPLNGSSSSLGFNSVSLVSSEFVDWIMENILQIPPEKPPIDSLLERGFCYSGGYYYYTGGFGMYLSTEIKELTSVYEISADSIYVVFSDVYTEGNVKTPEQSFAILQRKNGGAYSLLRLGMGEALLSADEVKGYPAYTAEAQTDSDENPKIKIQENKLMLPVLITSAVLSVAGIIGFIFALSALKKTRRR